MFFSGVAVGVLQRQHAAHVAVAMALEVGAGEDPDHAGDFLRRLGLDPLDDAMGVGAADHDGIELAGQADVVGVAAAALQQDRVFLPGHRLADAEFQAGQVRHVAVGHGDLSAILVGA